MSGKIQLPQREQTMFKRILRYYEQKQYKSGLKACKYILSQPKFSEHGETLALKGLILNCMSKKEEAYDLVRRGLKNDLTSHVCWHVYGLLYRSDKDYAQAIKCYRSALRFDKENTQILKDLSLLQIQMRDLSGFKSTRHQLLQVRPQQRVSWLAYAISLHLLGQYEEASKVIIAWEKTQAGEKEGAYEQSELIMYKASILVDAKDYKGALDHLQACEEDIVDKLALKELVVDLLIKLERFEEAEALTRILLKENVENNDYYAWLETCTKLGNGSPQEERVKLYKDVLNEYPRAHAPKRLPLMFTAGDLFKKLLDEYLRPCIRKGMSPVFRNIRKVYGDPAKVSIVEELGSMYLTSMKDHSKFDGKEETPKETPVVLVWVLYFMAQHYDHIGQLDKALALINEAIEHTPTILELYMVKAKINKHGGNLKEAAHWLNYARELDTADRFINSKCVKYMLRSGDVTKAEETASLFTRENNDPIASLSEMQCMWFETEEAAALLSNGEIGKALKKLSSISKNWDQMLDDQFDFHSYCLRKMTLRAYLALLRTEDKLKSHQLYFDSAIIAIRCYIGLHDVPYGSKQREEQDAAMAGLTPSELKKMISKQKKAARRAAEEKKSSAKTNNKKNNNDGSSAEKMEDEDPDGKLLARTENPLEEALKWLRPLQNLCPNRLLPNLMAFEIYFRKKKTLLMLHALKKSIKIDSESSDVFKSTARFLKFYNENKDSLHPTVKTVIEAELPDLKLVGQDSSALTLGRLSSKKDSFPDLVACAEITSELTGDKEKAAAILTGISDISSLSGVSAKLCSRALYVLKSLLGTGDAYNEFSALCSKTCNLADFEHQDYTNVSVV